MISTAARASYSSSTGMRAMAIGTGFVPYAALMLAGFRGAEAEATQLIEAVIADARAAGRPICGAVAEGGENVFTAALDPRSVLVIGAEGTGLPAGAYLYLDRRLTIPMREPVDSLNAAVATALLLYSPSLRRVGVAEEA